MGIRACPSMGAPVIYDILHIFDCGNFKSETRDTPWNGMGDFDLGSKKDALITSQRTCARTNKLSGWFNELLAVAYTFHD